MRYRIILLFLLSSWIHVVGQQARLDELNSELGRLKTEQLRVEGQIEEIKLEILRGDLLKYAVPALGEAEEMIVHSAMALVYAEEHEQARWVAHIIRPEMLEGNVGRTNDFRVDPKIATGSAVEEDYFLKTLQADGSYEYDGFGFDRGHLAPSADFRWSPIALSESYLYSNMSPQRPDFNRGIWADLEGTIRGYMGRHPGHQLLVVTGPVLKDGLPTSERSPNGVTIPEQYFKVVVDREANQGIGFLLPNSGSKAPLMSFVKTIDEVESLVGIDFFANLPDEQEGKVEASKSVDFWFPESETGDVVALSPPSLPRNHFNTSQAKLYMDRNDEVHICGKVVGARFSRKGNALLNLDKQYPNQVFTVFVRKEDLSNFSYDPVEEWSGRYIRVSGKVANLGGTPAMFVKREEDMRSFSPTGK